MKIDKFNIEILKAIQSNQSLAQRELAEMVNLSPNACWHRVQSLKDQGIIIGQSIRLDRKKLDLGLVVFVMIKTRHHSAEWLESFRKHVSKIPEVIDFYRIGGDYDYFLKIITRDIETYDNVYQKLISEVELDSVTSYFAMEAIEEQRPLPL
ncbi:MAG: Lrp/AsnC family transcriptional regulator [Rhizobiales bacterium]|nr:Lrp/AsnC family transcriptional regulator [Hyphomicrobiales bacterium]NRB13901.1 Lrp/AsnC family transcriptional regulator [Hyphomicrobiales bacterium]